MNPSKPEPRERAGDGLALRVEDLGLEHDVDDDPSHGAKATEVAQPNRRPVSRSYASTYFDRVRSMTSSGSGGGASPDLRSQPLAGDVSQSRTYCLSNDGCG